MTEQRISRLQLDLATVVARLEDLASDQEWAASDPRVRRVLTCDLARLRSHLTPRALALVRHWREHRREP